MLDAVPPAHLEPAKPVNAAQVSVPAPPISPAIAPVQKLAVSAPEAFPPESAPPVSAPRTVESKSTPIEVTPTQPPDSSKSQAKPIQETSIQPAIERAKAERLKLLEQKLAEIVAREKPLKEEKLRQTLKDSALNAAKAGQLNQARQTAQALELSPEMQAQLLAEISAIKSRSNAADATKITRLPRLPDLKHVHPVPKVSVEAPTPYSVIPSNPPIDNPRLNSGVTSTAGQEFQNWTLKGLANKGRIALPGNGNLSLIFPLPIPVSITSGFGWRVHPVRGDQRFHKGIDLGAPMGTPVIAAYAGKVALADWLDGYGLAIALSHNKDTQETLYTHLSEVFVKPGDWVEQGTVIGRVGNTGLSTGPHLHFEMRQLTSSGWGAVDPGAQLEVALAQLVKFLETGQTVASTANQVSQVPDPLEIYATAPPPPTQKRAITHNF